MSWTVARNEQTGHIETVYRGIISNKEVRLSTVAALKLAAPDKVEHFLSDLSEADSELSAVDICVIPDQWTELKANPANKVAVVVPGHGKMWRDGQFYEDVCVNRGWNVKVFANRDDALAWLGETDRQ